MISYRRSLLGLLLGSTLPLAAMGCGGGIEPGDYVLLRVAFADTEKNASCYVDGEIPKEIKDDSTSFRTGDTLILYRGPKDTYYLDGDTNVMEGRLQGDTFTFQGASSDVEYMNGKPAVLVLDSDHDGIDDNIDTAIDADKDGMDDKGIDAEVDVDMDGIDDRFGDDEVDVNGDGQDDRFKVVTPATDGDKYTTTNATSLTFTISNDEVSGSSEVTLTVTCEGATCPMKLPNCKQTIDFVGTLVKDPTIQHQL